MTVSLSTQSPLLDRFNAFYREVLRLKDEILEREAMEGAISANPLDVVDQLKAVLERQSVELKGTVVSANQLRDAHYAMVALADEVFLNTDWPNRDFWLGSLFEERTFHSQLAGDRVFQKIDVLVKKNDRDDLELARVYLMTLALGFQGRYRGADPDGEHQAYMYNLYYMIFQKDPSFSDSQTRIFPEAYEATLGKTTVVNLPRRDPWVFALVLWLAAIVLWTAYTYRDMTKDLDLTAREIIQIQKNHLSETREHPAPVIPKTVPDGEE